MAMLCNSSYTPNPLGLDANRVAAAQRAHSFGRYISNKAGSIRSARGNMLDDPRHPIHAAGMRMARRYASSFWLIHGGEEAKTVAGVAGKRRYSTRVQSGADPILIKVW